MTTANLRARVALAELEALGLTVEDLLAVAGQTARARPDGPTLAVYLPGVCDAYPAPHPTHPQLLLAARRGAHRRRPSGEGDV